MVRSRLFVWFMLMMAVLGGGAVLAVACSGKPSLCCCVTGADNIRECSPVTGRSEADACPGSLEPCMSIGVGDGPGAQAAPSEDGGR